MKWSILAAMLLWTMLAMGQDGLPAGCALYSGILSCDTRIAPEGTYRMTVTACDVACSQPTVIAIVIDYKQPDQVWVGRPGYSGARRLRGGPEWLYSFQLVKRGTLSLYLSPLTTSP